MKDLLQHCKYYKGEKKPSLTGDDLMFWLYEKQWVEYTTKKDTILSQFLEEYIKAGLTDFSKFDDTPIHLKALLFNRFEQWTQSDGFEQWYKQKYYKE